jgi:hypothetical protein
MKIPVFFGLYFGAIKKSYDNFTMFHWMIRDFND